MPLDNLKKAIEELDNFDNHELDRAAVVFAPMGILISEANGGIIRLNNFLCELLGYETNWDSKAEIKDLGWIELTHPDDRELDIEHAHMASTGKIKGYHITKRYRAKDSSWVWVKLSIRFYSSKNIDYPVALVYIVPVNAPQDNKAFVEEF